ncbi:MAG: GntR family transcriptional regulator [Alicyclobacillus sp.]|nr:GntR family transcriptional regulator [Alicyclobacillus sp.]
MGIQRSGEEPLYRQIQKALLAKLEQQPPLSPVPSERELCAEFQVSRQTIRKALDDLEQKGRIYRLPGKGTFVADKKYTDHELQWFIGFHEDASMQHKAPSSRILRQTVALATPEIATKLEIPHGTQLFVLERLRCVDDEPMCLVTSYIPLELCPDLLRQDFTNQSLYEFLLRNGLTIYKARRSIEVIEASSTEASYLEVQSGSPLLLFQSLGFLEQGSPFEYVRSRYPAYKARFESEVFRPKLLPGSGLG